jgi:hypothetical protein
VPQLQALHKEVVLQVKVMLRKKMTFPNKFGHTSSRPGQSLLELFSSVTWEAFVTL